MVTGQAVANVLLSADTADPHEADRPFPKAITTILRPTHSIGATHIFLPVNINIIIFNQKVFVSYKLTEKLKSKHSIPYFFLENRHQFINMTSGYFRTIKKSYGKKG